MFNGNEKQVLRNHFSEWHFKTLQRAMELDPTVIDVLPKTAAKKRALIAMLIRGVHEIMKQKIDLICRAWAKTGLYDDDLIADIVEDDNVDDELVNDMMRLALDKDEEAVLMDVDDELEPLPAEVAAEVFNELVHDLAEEVYHNEDVPNVSAHEVEDDEEEENWDERRKRILGHYIIDSEGDDASTSAESSHRVNLHRVKEGGAVRVTFTGKAKPSSEELLLILKRMNAVPQDTTVVSTTNVDESGYNLTLSNVRSSKLAGDHGAVVWFD